jgi:polysaccharide pyruvyl transferase WcaK-like protein
MLRFAKMMAKEVGGELAWLPWFGARRRHRWLLRAMRVHGGSGWSSLPEILDKLASCDLIITDTYHLCVNAWRLGTPAVCIGAGAEECPSTVSDKKKEILYLGLGAQTLYIFRESLASRAKIRAAAQAAAAMLACRDYVAAIHSRIRHDVDSAETQLAAAIRGAITSP